MQMSFTHTSRYGFVCVGYSMCTIHVYTYISVCFIWVCVSKFCVVTVCFKVVLLCLCECKSSLAFTMKVLGGCTDLGHNSNFDYKDYEHRVNHRTSSRSTLFLLYMFLNCWKYLKHMNIVYFCVKFFLNTMQ